MDETKNYIEATITIPRPLTDAITNFIVEYISSGLIIEEEDDNPETIIKFYLIDDHDKSYNLKIEHYFRSLKEIHPEYDLDIIIKEKVIQNVEWEESYKESVKSIFIETDICVRPPWDSINSDTVYDIIVEPKMAFGTGSHETTRGCLRAIRNYFKDGSSFADLGCGSGVLSILAAKMGASYIKAVDYDPISVDNTLENFEINQVKCKSDVLLGSIEQFKNDQPYDYVCANIIKVTILSMIDELHRLTKKKGYLILSGLLDIDENDIIEQLLKLGLNDYNIIPDNEWRTFVIRKK